MALAKIFEATWLKNLQGLPENAIPDFLGGGLQAGWGVDLHL